MRQLHLLSANTQLVVICPFLKRCARLDCCPTAGAAYTSQGVSSAVLEAAREPETAWAAVEQLKELIYCGGVKLLKQLAQRMALPISACTSLHVCIWIGAVLHLLLPSPCTTVNVTSAHVDHQK